MKKTLFILVVILVFSCQKTSERCSFSEHTETRNYILNHFTKVEVNPMIELTIYQSVETKMIVTADENVFKNIDYQIVNNKLVLTNHTDCLVENSQGIVYISLYVPELLEIIANTDLDIYSGNIWHFNNLSIYCENESFGNNNIADFHLNLFADRLKIVANGSSIFSINGETKHLFVGFYGGNPIIKARNFQADSIQIYHRSDADMHLYPKNIITGDLYGYGDLYLYNHPPEIHITEHYRGNIYFVN